MNPLEQHLRDIIRITDNEPKAHSRPAIIDITAVLSNEKALVRCNESARAALKLVEDGAA